MKLRWLVVLLALASLGLLLRSWSGGARGKTLVPADRVEESSPPAASLQEPLPMAARPAPRQEVPGEAVARATGSDRGLAEVFGRFVLPGGSPAPEVACALTGWQANRERVERYGEPDDWQDRSTVSDADGRFSIRFDPPRAYQFSLDAGTPGFAGVSWRWGEILPGARVDVGEIELLEGCVIEGRILDEEGNPQVGERWLVYARSVGLGEFDGRDESQVIVPVDPVTATFRAADVMPGKVELEGYERPNHWIKHGLVQLVPGETRTVDLVDARPEPSSKITVDATAKGLRSIRADPERITLIDASGNPRDRTASRFLTVHFENLEEGEYTLRIDDPRFLPFSTQARPGKHVTAALVGNSALQLDVRTEAGTPVPVDGVHVALRNVSFRPSEFPFPKAPGDGLLSGLVAGDYRVLVEAGGEIGAVEVDDLAAGETRAVEVRVGPAHRLRGVVRHADGSPAADVEVGLFPLPEVDSPLWRTAAQRALFDPNVLTGTTGPEGAFRFPIPREGRYRVRAWTENGSEGSAEVTLVPGHEPGEVVVVLPRGGILAGRIHGPPGATYKGMRLWVGDAEFVTSIQEAARDLDADGRFEVGPIRAGTFSVRLLLPLQPQHDRGGISYSTGLMNDLELGTVEIPEGGRLERDFEVGDYPGLLSLDVTQGSEPARRVSISARMTRGEKVFELHGMTDVHGRFGPALAFPGEWWVQVQDSDLGWRSVHPVPLGIAAARETHARVLVDLEEVTLCVVDEATGRPWSRRRVALLGPSPQAFPTSWSRLRETDAAGCVVLPMAPGEYVLRLEPEEDPGETFHFTRPEDDRRPRAGFLRILGGPRRQEVRIPSPTR